MPALSSLTHPKWTGLLTIAALSSLVFASAMLVVFTKHQARQLFTQLQVLEHDVESLQIEWTQLLLEQGTWAADARLERIARERLQLVLPEPNEVVVLPNSLEEQFSSAQIFNDTMLNGK